MNSGGKTLEKEEMRKLVLLTTTIGVGLLSVLAYAAAPANAPAGTTGLCNDGTFYSGATKKGACKGHKGVKDWYGEPAAAAPAAAPSAAAAPAKPAPATPGAATPAPAPQAAPTPATNAPPKVAAAGGGAGKVWVNKDTKVYHCPGDRWYGKTKEGEYLSEADAKAQGFKPDHGKACK
jgi:hypothetical protein